MTPKTYFIQTYGCQMNVRDSELVAGMLEGLGFEKSPSLESNPDVFIVNTCSVRQTSEDKVYGLYHKVGAIKEANPTSLAIVMGCMVGSVRGQRTRYDESLLLKRLSWADALYETSEITSLPEFLKSKGLIGSSSVNEIIPEVRGDKKHAFINISTGCDNFCTFCVVPFARGEEKSRTKAEILAEVKKLADFGYTQFTLLGQNVNSWGILDLETKRAIRTLGDTPLPFADLLRSIHEIPEVERISFVSSNPFDFTQDLVQTLALPKISRYLHLAVQSGDDEVLKKMNRRHSHLDFLKLVEAIRESVPDIQFGTDLIVGFPSESDEAFENTVKLCEKVKFSVAYVSKYSPRAGTNAEKFMKDDVSPATKSYRHKRLSEIIDQNKPAGQKGFEFWQM